ncbi:MAG: Sapep family Mn(2+)-dependent dipeptidase [Clostridia bacterium]|nr:Sapep family Mn(2+)-dependent dipeptidase [Clostridia bacterium]
MVDTLLFFLAVDSVQGAPADGAPFGAGTKEMLDKFFSLATSIGMRTKNIDGYCGFAEIGEGELLGIPVHLDTVPFGEDWTRSPFGEMAEEDGETRIYGRGAEDDKGPAVAVMYALKALLDEGRAPRRRIRVIAGLNEESGWKCIEHYLEKEEIPSMSFSPDADFPVIFCEKGVLHARVTLKKPAEVISFSGGERVNMVADRAALEVTALSDAAFSKCLKGGIKVKFIDGGFRLSAEGVSAHGSTPDKGENAILKILYAVKSTSEDLADLYDYFHMTDGSGLGLKLSDEVSGELTLNVGKVESTEDTLTFSLDIRYPVSYTEEQVLKSLETALSEGAVVTVQGRHLPLHVAKDSELVKSLIAAYNEVTGETAEPIAIGGATYARAFPNAVAFGPVFPGEDSRIHQKDESISLDNFLKCAEIYRKALEKLAF